TLLRLRAKVIAGGANNQLADPETGRAVFDGGILYLPDYVINGGGIINVAGEIRALDRGEAFDPAWVEARLSHLMETLDEVLDRSKAERRPTQDVAGEIAKARISRAAERKAAA
ncbi:MAG TPA: amino acid dehydrogenase, partial [Thermoanaerobaculia bacterium]